MTDKQLFTSDEVTEPAPVNLIEVVSFAIADDGTVLCFDAKEELVLSLPREFIEDAYEAIQ